MKSEKTWAVNADYELGGVHVFGVDIQVDDVLEKAAERMADASGSGFGFRDLSWYEDDTPEGAWRARLIEKRLNAAVVDGYVIRVTRSLN